MDFVPVCMVAVHGAGTVGAQIVLFCIIFILCMCKLLAFKNYKLNTGILLLYYKLFQAYSHYKITILQNLQLDWRHVVFLCKKISIGYIMDM